MNHTAFLNALRADPGDDTTRLVHADWLDEQGDAARGEFIRVQVRLAKMDEDDPDRLALEARERALLEEHEKAWVGAVPGCVSGWTWRGGFIDQVVFRGDGKIDRASELFERHPIREVVLDRVPNLEQAAGCDLLADVSALSIKRPDNATIDRGLERLVNSAHVRGLSGLTLDGVPVGRRPGRVLAQAPLHRLRRLELRDPGLDLDMSAYIRALLKSRSLSALDELYAFSGYSADPDLRAISSCPERWLGLGLRLANRAMDLARCRNLRRLVLEGPQNEPPLLASWPNVENVSLGTCGVTFLSRLAALGTPPTLQQLSLTLPGVDDPEAQQELSSLLARLSRPILWLTVERVSDNGPRPWAKAVRHLDRLAGLTIQLAGSLGGLADDVDLSGLRELDLSAGPYVPPAGLARLLASPTLRRLHKLRLAAHEIDDEIVRVLVESPHLARLRELSLHGRSSSECIRRLAGWPGLARLERLGLHPPPIRAPSSAVGSDLLGSPYLSRLTCISLSGISVPNAVGQSLRERFGWRITF